MTTSASLAQQGMASFGVDIMNGIFVNGDFGAAELSRLRSVCKLWKKTIDALLEGKEENSIFWLRDLKLFYSDKDIAMQVHLGSYRVRVLVEFQNRINPPINNSELDISLIQIPTDETEEIMEQIRSVGLLRVSFLQSRGEIYEPKNFRRQINNFLDNRTKTILFEILQTKLPEIYKNMDKGEALNHFVDKEQLELDEKAKVLTLVQEHLKKIKEEQIYDSVKRKTWENAIIDGEIFESKSAKILDFLPSQLTGNSFLPNNNGGSVEKAYAKFELEDEANRNNDREILQEALQLLNNQQLDIAIDMIASCSNETQGAIGKLLTQQGELATSDSYMIAVNLFLAGIKSL